MNEQLAAKSENRMMSAGMKCKIAGNAHTERRILCRHMMLRAELKRIDGPRRSKLGSEQQKRINRKASVHNFTLLVDSR